MRITWIGHSSFLLETASGVKIVTDPFDNNIGYSFPKVSADLVTVSHAHSDHNRADLVAGNPTVICREGEYDFGGVHIFAYRTSHDDRNGTLRGNNLVFIFHFDGLVVCHMGDIGERRNETLAHLPEHINVLMIPVGGNYTVDAEGAKEYVDGLKPDVVIPMHYKTPDLNLDIDGVGKFLSLKNDYDITYEKGSTAEFTKADFDGHSTKVVVLNKLSR